jgi:hypothetical protein
VAHRSAKDREHIGYFSDCIKKVHENIKVIHNKVGYGLNNYNSILSDLIHHLEIQHNALVSENNKCHSELIELLDVQKIPLDKESLSEMSELVSNKIHKLLDEKIESALLNKSLGHAQQESQSLETLLETKLEKFMDELSSKLDSGITNKDLLEQQLQAEKILHSRLDHLEEYLKGMDQEGRVQREKILEEVVQIKEQIKISPNRVVEQAQPLTRQASGRESLLQRNTEQVTSPAPGKSPADVRHLLSGLKEQIAAIERGSREPSSIVREDNDACEYKH